MMRICRAATLIASRLGKCGFAVPRSAGLFQRGTASKLIRGSHHRVLLYLLLNLVFTASVAAQSVDVGMTHHIWGLEDGLPDRVIQAIAQTPDGYLWLGTPHGLVRFDGFKFVTTAAQIAPSLREFGVSCILVAKDGTLWIGSVGGGVTHLNSNSHIAIHFGREQGLDALTIRALYQSRDGTVWAGTDSGLYKLVNGRFNFVEGYGDQNVTAVVSDRSGGLGVAGESLTHYQDGRFVTVPIPPLKSVIRAMAVAPDGGLWIGGLGTLLERRKDGSFRIIQNVNTDVRTLCFDENGRLWIGTIGSGVLVRMPDGAIIRELDPNEPDFKAVRAVVNTRNGDLWIGTQAGLIRLSHTGMDFVKMPNSRTADFGSVFVDHDDSVWLSGGNLAHYADGKEHTVSLPGIKGAQIRAVYRDSSGAFWVGTVANGVYRLVGGHVVAHLVNSGAITGFIGAPDGTVWIGTDLGLAKWSHGKFTCFTHYRGVPMSTVKAMAVAGDGSIWIATPAGLFLFRNGEYVRPKIARKLANERIWSLYTGKNGSLWIGAGTGLYLWRNGILRHINLHKFSAQSKAVVSILMDSKDRFLIAEPAVVFRIPRNEMTRSVAASPRAGPDGIQEVRLLTPPEIFSVGSETGAEFYSEIPGVASSDRQGGAWYATYRGLLHIEASPLSRPPVPPPITIEKILVDGVSVPANGPIILPASTHNIQIQATPILLSGSTGLRLRRRLFGFDDKWSGLVPGSSSSYGKLVPGRYTFKVEAYWPGTNVISSTEVAIVQQSAIYQRKSFIAVCCALLVLLAWLLYRSRIRQMRLRFQAVADERSRVAREIHDTLLQGCIGALSLLEALEISHERVRDHLQTGQENRWLTVVKCVREQFGETIKEAREAIWNLRNAEDHKSLDEALRDALERLTSRAEIETSFQIEGETVPIIPRIQHEIIMSAREAIMNSVSHARSASIIVRLSFDSNCVNVSVSDDGVGFDPEAIQQPQSHHFGISGMRDRMHKVRGSITIDSVPGRGTQVCMSLPLAACRIRSNA